MIQCSIFTFGNNHKNLSPFLPKRAFFVPDELTPLEQNVSAIGNKLYLQVLIRRKQPAAGGANTLI